MSMTPNTKSLLQELTALGDLRDKRHMIATRANNVISSAVHLLELITSSYGSEQADMLEKKLMNAIKNRDPAKFTNHIRKINESK